jgi:hypothetical protein
MRVKNYANGNTCDTRQHLDKWHKFCTVSSEKRLTQGWSGTKASAVSANNFGDLVPNVTTATFTEQHAGSAPVLSLVGGSATGVISVGDVLTFKSAVGNIVGPLTVASLNAAGTSVTFVEDSAVVPNYADVSEDQDYAQAPNQATDLVLVSCDKSELAYHVETYSPNLTRVTIKAHGIPIYNNFPSGFFNAYIPYNYGGHNIRAPRDVGALLITFCLYPGTYQPSGHINISRAREFYIDYETTPLINAQNGVRGTLSIVASAINFLLISDGSAVLRYST